VVFSADFSHYLPQDVAERHDAATRRAMADNDIGAIARMDNGYVDSKVTVMAAMLMADRLGGQLDELAHGNSNGLGAEKTASTTSYFVLAARRK
jgi:AmmeMemoRadiSam system protein B